MPRAVAARELPPPLELLCLRALWALGEASVKDVRQAVLPRRNLAYTTVMTLLDRLARKGFLSRRKVGRAFLYAPRVARDTLRRIALGEFVDSYFDGSTDRLREFMAGQSGDGAPVASASDAEPEVRLDTALL